MLVEILEASHGVLIELRYGTADNFTGQPVYRHPRCYLHRDAAALLARAVDLAARQGVTVEKRLLWTDSLGINLEGLCLGPLLADGNRGLIAIADNGGIGTPNQLVGLALVTPAPAIRPAVLGAVAALLAIALLVGRLTSP